MQFSSIERRGVFLFNCPLCIIQMIKSRSVEISNDLKSPTQRKLFQCRVTSLLGILVRKSIVFGTKRTGESRPPSRSLPFIIGIVINLQVCVVELHFHEVRLMLKFNEPYTRCTTIHRSIVPSKTYQ